MQPSDLGDEARLRDLLSGLSFLAVLPPGLREVVVDAFVTQHHEFGDEIVREGDQPDGFYALLDGVARVFQERHGAEVTLMTLHGGDTFGEAGLLEGSPRQASVRASAPCTVARLDPALFVAIQRRHPEVRAAFEQQLRSRRLLPLLRQHAVFAAVPPEALMPLLPSIVGRDLLADEVLVHAGDRATSLFVVAEGRLRATDADGSDLRYLRSGDLVGERALYLGEPRSATVRALTDAHVLEIGSEVFEQLRTQHPEVERRVREQISIYDRGPAQHVPLDFVGEVPVESSTGLDAPIETGDRIPPPSEDTASARRWWSRFRSKRRHVAVVRQLDMMDCGAACLTMVCRAFGRNVPIGHVRDLIGTSVDGTSLRGLQRGGELLGLEVRAIKASKSRLDELPLPAIVHWKGNHWMVLDEVRADAVHVADPGVGGRWIDRDRFIEDWSGFTALPSPTERLAEVPEESASLRWMLPFVRPHRRALAVVLGLALAGSALQMVIPLVTGRIIDEVVQDRDYGRLYVYTIGLVVLQFLALGAALWQGRVLSRVAVRMDGASLDHLAGVLFRLPLRYFESRRSGDIEQRLDGMGQVREFAVGQGIAVITGVTQLVAAMCFMAVTSWMLVLAWLATTPVYLLLMRRSSAQLRPAFVELEEGFARYRSRQLDGIHGIETVKSMGAEDGLQRRMVRDFDDFADRVIRANSVALGYGGLVSAVTMLQLVLFLFLGALQTMNGNLTVGELIAFNSLVILATAPLGMLLGLWDQWQIVSVAVSRLQDIMGHEPEQAGDRDLRPVPSLEGRVTLTNVGFRYPSSPDVPILDGVTLDVQPGTTVALVGRSGSGKSTLLKCLAGLFPVTDGSIEYDGVPLEQVDWRELRRRIGMVPQRPHVFDDTIAANIAFGEETPDLQRVREAAEIADAHGFVNQLPLGYSTKVGDGGLRLSGGQAQRVSIARSIYHRPSVVLLDEATSALDAESERAVTSNMRRLLQGRTAFVVAHRLSTVRDADLIVVLERGRIVETGTHDELLAHGGLYFHLYGQQAAD